MDKVLGKSAKRLHAIKLRDAAIAMVRRDGRADGNAERNGIQTRMMELQRGGLTVLLLEASEPLTREKWARDPTANMIVIRSQGAIVFRLGWDGGRINLITYQPGMWERWFILERMH